MADQRSERVPAEHRHARTTIDPRSPPDAPATAAPLTPGPLALDRERALPGASGATRARGPYSGPVHKHVVETALNEQTAELLAAYQEIEAERQRYQALFEFAPDGYLVTDARAVIREANRAAGQLLNMPVELLIGKPLGVLVAHDDRWHFHGQVARLTQIEQIRDWTIRLQRLDGSPIPVSLTVAAVRNRTGETTGLRWLLRDITERVRLAAAESSRQRQREALIELEQRLVHTATLADLLDETATLVSDTLGVEGCHIFELESCSDTLHLRATTASAPSGAGSITVSARTGTQMSHVLAAGSPVIVADVARESRFLPVAWLRTLGAVSVVSTAIGGRPGPFGVLSVHTARPRDFTQDEVHFLQAVTQRLALAALREQTDAAWAQHLARAEASAANARELEAMRRSLLSAVSHEMLTPLAIIKGHAETLQDPTTRADAAVATSALVAIDEEVDRLRRIVSNLLDAARATSGVLVVERVPMALGMLIERTVDRFRGRSRRHGFTVQRPATLPLVLGDANRLESVLYNLLDNAVKYAPRGGEVLVRVEVAPLEVEVSVEDQGVGIAPAEHALIFQPYYRATASGRPSAEGAGLGLYICKSVVEAHGGRIRVESLPWQGTAVRFTVPRADHDATSGRAAAGARA